MTTMAKMAISICLLAIGIYVSWFVKLGDLTFRDHVLRIARTPEVHDLGTGIASAVGSAKSAVKTRVAARLQASRQAGEEGAEEPEIEP